MTRRLMKTPNTPTETIAPEAVALDRKERMLDGFAILLSHTSEIIFLVAGLIASTSRRMQQIRCRRSNH